MDVSEAPSTKRGGRTRAIWGAFTFVTAAYVVSLIWQVASVLFGSGATGAAGARHLPEGPCRSGLVEVGQGLDEALARASAERDDDAASRAFEGARAEHDARLREITAICEGVEHGPEAAAAVARLSRAAESAVRRKGQTLAPVRREVDSFIRAPR